MKKIKFFAFMLLAGAATFLSSCGGDDEKDPPSVTISPASVDAWRADTVTLTITMSCNQKLEELTITPDVDAANQSETVTVFSGDYSASHTYEYVIPGTVSDGDYITITVKVTDADDLFTTVTRKIDIVEPSSGGNPIYNYTAILMGAQSNSTDGSFLDVSTATVYLQSGATANQSLIDIVYYYGSANLATLCAPDEVTVGGGSGNLTLCSGWTTKNATRFGSSTVTSTEFDAMTDDATIATIGSLSASKMNMLSQGNIIAFTNADGKKGLAKVTAIVTGNTGSITIDVKVQQ